MDLFAWENEWQCQVEVIAACKIIIIIPILFSIIKVCIGRNYGPILLSTNIDYSGVVVVVWARGRWWYSEVNENINHHSVGLFVSCNLSIKFANIWIQWCVDALPLYVFTLGGSDWLCVSTPIPVCPSYSEIQMSQPHSKQAQVSKIDSCHCECFVKSWNIIILV